MHMFNPAHPGEVLKEAYLDPLEMSVTEFARRIGISRKCASEFVNKHAGMSVEMAHRRAKATDTTAEFWLTMQVQASTPGRFIASRTMTVPTGSGAMPA